jgi:hypothetical protein
MALQTRAAKAAIKAAVDAVVDKLDAGTGTADNPRVRLYNGSQPASPDAAINTTTNTLIAELDLGTAAVFGAAATGTGAETSYIKAEAANLPVTNTAATATGTPTWFRAVDADGTPILDGSVGTTATTADLVLDNTSIVAGQTVKLNSWKVRQAFK